MARQVIARGIRLDGDGPRPAREAKTVLVRDGEVSISDGPFAETEEVICGYDVLECANLEEAVKVAAAHPVAAFGKIEVRAFSALTGPGAAWGALRRQHMGRQPWRSSGTTRKTS